MQNRYAAYRPSGFPVHPPMLSQPGQVDSLLDDPGRVQNKPTATGLQIQRKNPVEQICRTSHDVLAVLDAIDDHGSLSFHVKLISHDPQGFRYGASPGYSRLASSNSVASPWMAAASILYDDHDKLVPYTKEPKAQVNDQSIEKILHASPF